MDDSFLRLTAFSVSIPFFLELVNSSASLRFCFSIEAKSICIFCLNTKTCFRVGVERENDDANFSFRNATYELPD